VKITLLSREEMDPLRDFIAEYCQLDPEKKMWAHPQPTRVGAPCAESVQGINSSKTTKNENSCEYRSMARKRNESVTPQTPSLPLSEPVMSRKPLVAARGEEDGAA